jgi:hypothetical protein
MFMGRYGDDTDSWFFGELTLNDFQPIQLRTILNYGWVTSRENFSDLTEREVLAAAISSEEEDSRIYKSFVEDLAEWRLG